MNIHGWNGVMIWGMRTCSWHAYGQGINKCICNVNKFINKYLFATLNLWTSLWKCLGIKERKQFLITLERIFIFLYHLSHIPSLFCLNYFSGSVLCFCSDWPRLPSPIYAPHVVRITGMCHHTQLLCWDLVNLLPGLALNWDSPNLYLLSN
jgi:hypothetical protein